MKGENDSGIVLLFVGLGLGLLAGLLWAPRRGREMRGELRSNAASGWSAIAGEGAKIKSETRRWLETIKDRLCKVNGGADREPTG